MGNARMTCRLCHRGANEINGYLKRMNEVGVLPAVWECRPWCNTDISREDAIIQAITGEDDGVLLRQQEDS